MLTEFKDSRRSALSRLHCVADSSIMCSANAIRSDVVSPSGLSGGVSALLSSASKASQSILRRLKKSSFLEKMSPRAVSSSMPTR